MLRCKVNVEVGRKMSRHKVNVEVGRKCGITGLEHVASHHRESGSGTKVSGLVTTPSIPQHLRCRHHLCWCHTQCESHPPVVTPFLCKGYCGQVGCGAECSTSRGSKGV